MSIKFKVNENKCIHCGLCIKDCMPHVFSFDENKIPVANTEREKMCIRCQHCLSVCPVGAISILDKNPDESSKYKNEFNSDNVLELIKERKSIRNYKHKNIDTDKMQRLKDMLKYVPTGVNNHSLHFSFVEDVKIMDKIRTKVNELLLEHFKKDKDATRNFIRYIKQIKKGEDIIFRYAPHVVVVSNSKDAPCKDIDPVIALSYFELYAKSLGIGTCWCGLAYHCLNMIPELKKLFKVPETHDVGYVMLFGYPEFNYKRATQPEEYKIETVNL